MKISKIIYLFVAICTIESCSSAYDKKVIGRYHLVAIDVPEQMCIAFEHDNVSVYETIIPSTVFAVGYNDEYLIVKQHPRQTDLALVKYPGQPNKDITNYYIIPIHKEDSYSDLHDTIGPLTIDQFNNKRHKLNISDNLNFTIKLDNLK